MEDDMKTDGMTPGQIDRTIRDLSEQKKRIVEEQYSYEFGESRVIANKKSISMSKSIINWTFIVIGVAGIIGSFWDGFDMIKYVMFLKEYALIWAPLVIAVGGGEHLRIL